MQETKLQQVDSTQKFDNSSHTIEKILKSTLKQGQNYHKQYLHQINCGGAALADISPCRRKTPQHGAHRIF
jgi:hypothetical protein